MRANGDPPPPPAEPSRPHARVRKIVEPILRARETPWDDVISPSRRHELIATRIVVYVALHNAGFSMKQIGRFCERDHTTILHYLRKWAGYKSKPRKVDPYRVTFKKRETKP
jgi:chromosomal replication initiation ATPase DnaA